MGLKHLTRHYGIETFDSALRDWNIWWCIMGLKHLIVHYGIETFDSAFWDWNIWWCIMGLKHCERSRHDFWGSLSCYRLVHRIHICMVSVLGEWLNDVSACRQCRMFFHNACTRICPLFPDFLKIYKQIIMSFCKLYFIELYKSS